VSNPPPDPRKTGLKETDRKTGRKTPVNQPKLFQYMINKLHKQQVLREHPDPMVCHLRDIAVRPDDDPTGEITFSRLREQVTLLLARHLYVAQSVRITNIAKQCCATPADIHDWIDSYNWQDMRQMRKDRRTKRFALTSQANAHVIEQRTMRVMAKAQTVCLDLFDAHLNDETRLDPSGVKALTDAAKTAFEVLGGITGSEKVGEKVHITVSGEVNHAINDYFKQARFNEAPKKQISNGNRKIRIEDAEFDTPHTAR